MPDWHALSTADCQTVVCSVLRTCAVTSQGGSTNSCVPRTGGDFGIGCGGVFKCFVLVAGGSNTNEQNFNHVQQLNVNTSAPKEPSRSSSSTRQNIADPDSTYVQMSSSSGSVVNVPPHTPVDHAKTASKEQLALHEAGNCTPCNFHQTVVGCFSGDACPRCHLPHTRKNRTKPNKAKRDRQRRLATFLLVDGEHEGKPNHHLQLCDDADGENGGPSASQSNCVRGKGGRIVRL